MNQKNMLFFYQKCIFERYGVNTMNIIIFKGNLEMVIVDVE